MPQRIPSTEREFTRLVAPCGLFCGGCLAFAGGPIRSHARALADLLGPNFAAYAERLSAMDPALCEYPQFARVLEFLARGTCRGCREGGCLLGNCGVRACALERGVNVCGLCPDFPCENPGLPEALLEGWRKNGERIRDNGPAAFLELVRSRPRYP
ncbi:MAG: DUF3795 domain-containing protein [Proteobacteria bacterium]|nr:DUF3795 domain-containing protein [Pseudomonadota bacterium]